MVDKSLDFHKNFPLINADLSASFGDECIGEGSFVSSLFSENTCENEIPCLRFRECAVAPAMTDSLFGERTFATAMTDSLFGECTVSPAITDSLFVECSIYSEMSDSIYRNLNIAVETTCSMKWECVVLLFSDPKIKYNTPNTISLTTNYKYL